MDDRHAVIGLGASLGDRRRWLRLAVAAWRASWEVTVERVARPVWSRGIGPGVGPFLNTAVRVRTTLAPLELLDRCKDIEARLGRRPSRRWGERAIDCDLLLVDDVRWADRRLLVPHAHFFERRFAVEPARAVAPDLRLPGGEGLLRDVPVPPVPRTWPEGRRGGHRRSGRVRRRADGRTTGPARRSL